MVDEDFPTHEERVEQADAMQRARVRQAAALLEDAEEWLAGNPKHLMDGSLSEEPDHTGLPTGFLPTARHRTIDDPPERQQRDEVGG